jgi:acetyltransferase-like isoleucine patch superfamily enzyme
MRKVLAAISVLMPWFLKRRYLSLCFGYELHPSARIGCALVTVGHLKMEDGAKVGSFTIMKGIDRVVVGERSSIGSFCLITGFPSSTTRYFRHVADRSPSLTMGRHSAITRFHLIDCNAAITIGDFTTVAGYFSQLLTHSIDVYENRQDAKPIRIGDYCFIGTNSVVLGGVTIADRCVTGAKSLINKPLGETDSLYAGVPARRVKSLEGCAYFTRETGWVH